MAIKIDKNVPLPALCARTKYPFSIMEVGDSFAVPLSGEITSAGKNGPYDKMLVRMRSAACVHQKRHGGRFICRTFQDEGVIRVWKVA